MKFLLRKTNRKVTAKSKKPIHINKEFSKMMGEVVRNETQDVVARPQTDTQQDGRTDKTILDINVAIQRPNSARL